MNVPQSPLLPSSLLRNVHRSQDTRCDRSAVLFPSCSLWPCWKLPSRPVYLSVCSLLFQKGPMAPAVAVTAPQQAPMVMAPQAPVVMAPQAQVQAGAQASSQPALPPQTSAPAAPGASVISQVCTLLCSSLPASSELVRLLKPQCCHSCQLAGCVTTMAMAPHSWA